MSKGWLIPCALMLFACEAETIVVAEDPDANQTGLEDAGQDAGMLDCESNADCESSDFCEKSSCDAPMGRCRAMAVSCSSEERPVCGCDGITYFNDCLRQQYGVNLADSEVCLRDKALPCGGPPNLTCPGNATCFRLIQAQPPEPPLCPPANVPGACWMLPSECNQAPMGGGSRFSRCEQRECLDLCNALDQSDDAPLYRVERCRR